MVVREAEMNSCSKIRLAISKVNSWPFSEHHHGKFDKLTIFKWKNVYTSEIILKSALIDASKKGLSDKHK